MSVRKAVSSQTISDDKIALRVKILKIYNNIKPHIFTCTFTFTQPETAQQHPDKNSKYGNIKSTGQPVKMNCCPRCRSLLGALSLDSSPEEPTSPAIIVWSQYFLAWTVGPRGIFHS